jgi:hypothetical protein
VRLSVLLAGAVVAATVVPVSAPAGAQGVVPELGTERERAVQAVLDAREAALRSGDKEAFLGTLDPSAPKPFVEAQGRLYEGLRTVPFSKYELIVRTDEIEDLSAGLARRYPEAEEVFLPPVEGRYRIEGADTTDALDGLFYTFVLRDGRWRIVSDSDLADLGLPSARNPWDFGPVQVHRSDHFTVLFDRRDRRRALDIAAVAEEAYGRLAGTYDRPLPDQFVFVLPHTVAQLRDMIQATFDLSNFVAFAAATVDRDRGWDSTAPRIYAQEENLAGSPKDFQLQTLHHELIHAAAFPLAGPFVPAWVHEGTADWLASGRGEPTAVDGSDKILPEDYEFTTGGQSAIISAYDESTSAAAFLADAVDDGSPLDLLVTVGAPRVAPGTSDYHVDAALRKVYGQGTAEFQAAWDGGS